MNKVVTEPGFISEINLWAGKGHNPLTQVEFLIDSNNKRLVGIRSYTAPDALLYLDDKAYGNYMYALQRVGALFDKAALSPITETE